ncbi:MAG: amino acid adenylation domain-containing protein [Planctomycetota bacterium]
MSAESLYDELRSQGVELWCQGKMLRYRAPDGVLDQAAMAKLRKHKKELLQILRREADSRAMDRRLEPTTVGQQAMYFMHLSAPYSPAYNVASAFRLLSPVTTEQIRHAWTDLVERHESLRTTVQMHGAELKREIHHKLPLDFEVVDASTMSDEQLKQTVQTDYERPFDLAAGPLLRVRVFRRGEADQVILIALHHIIFDAWSLWILQDEFLRLLDPVVSVADLPIATKSFGDFVREQETVADTPQGVADLDYWKNELAGPLPVLTLPTDRVRSRRSGCQGATHRFRIGADDAAAIRATAKQLRVTPFVLTLAMFKATLYRLTGQSDLVIGTTTSGRTASQWTQTIGYFVNTLPIRASVQAAAPFADLVATVKEKVLRAIGHQSVPFATVMDRLPGRNAATSAPVFNVMFGLHKPKFTEVADILDGEDQPIDVVGQSVAAFPLDQQEGQCDLTLELFETPESFLGSLKYDTELFDGETVSLIAEQFQQLARSVTREPQQLISEIGVVSTSQAETVMRWSQGSPMPEWDGRLSHQTVTDHASSTPERIAWIHDDVPVTYRELDDRSNAVAHRLIGMGVRPGQIIACMIPRGGEVAELILGIWKSGGVYMPLDPDSPVQRLEQMIRDGRADALLTNEPTKAPHDGLRVISLSDLVGPSATAASINRPDVSVEPTDTAYILHTSGSTGLPKGVVVSHEKLAKHVLAVNESFQLTSDDRVLQFSNLTFDPSIEQMLVPWRLGGCVVMRGNSLWSHDILASQIERHRITMLNVPPTYFEQCPAGPLHEAVDDDGPLSSLRLIILGGDVFPTHAALQGWRQRGVRLLNAYGPTETIITATTHQVDYDRMNRPRMPIGRPRAGTRVYVLDDKKQLCAPCARGRLYIAGELLADGYLGDDGLNEKVFVPDPLARRFGDASQARMYDTGDLARWNRDGELEFLGRADSQIKIDGIRTDTSEVCRVIKQVDRVQHCHVGFYPAKTADGDDDVQRRLVAWVGTSMKLQPSQAECLQDEIQAVLKQRLPRHMVPRHIVILEQLPLNPSGKVCVASLPAPPVSEGRALSDEYVAPQNQWQSTLAKIWADELGVTPVGIHDNFFDLGGASLTSLRIIAKANDSGLASHLNGQGRDAGPKPSSDRDPNFVLQPEMLFEHQTIAELYDYLHHRPPAPLTAPDPAANASFDPSNLPNA